MLIKMESDLDEWEKWVETYELEQFPIKKQTIEEKVLKEELEQANQQSVNDLFKINTTTNTTTNITTNTTTNTMTNMKTKSDYTNYAKECSNKMKTHKATSIGLLSFCKTIIDENCLKISVEHLEDLLEHIHKLKDSKSFKPIIKSNQSLVKINKQNHSEIFGDCTEEFDEEHLRIEDRF